MRTRTFFHEVLRTCSVCGNTYDIQKDEIGYPQMKIVEEYGFNFQCVSLCKKCSFRLLDAIITFYLLSNEKWIFYLGKNPNELKIHCKSCNVLFIQKHGNQKYCSEECRLKERRIYKRNHQKKSYHKNVISRRPPKYCKYCGKPIDSQEHGNRHYHSDCWDFHRYIYKENFATERGFPTWNHYKKYTSTFCWNCKKPYVFHIIKKEIIKEEDILYVIRTRKCQNCGRKHVSKRKRRLFKESPDGTVNMPW